MRRPWKHALCLTIVGAVLLISTDSASAAQDPVSYWNTVAIQVAATAGQGVPPTARTLAMVHLAIHDALNTIDSRYERYALTGTANPGSSPAAAIAAAAHDTLVGVVSVGALSFPGFGSPASQANAVAQVNGLYSTFLDTIPNGSAKTDGIAVGHAAAVAILDRRANDHATDFVPYTPGTQPGNWQPTPNPVPPSPSPAVDRLPAALPGWGLVTPFVLRRATQFEPSRVPRLSGPQWARDYEEVKLIGSQTSVVRTAEQTEIAKFWYEPSAHGWSRIGRVVAESHLLDTWQTARLLALMNVAMAEGYIGSFSAKFNQEFWRPVTAIRAGDTDGNDATIADPTWSSLLNTPNMPDYTSGHSVLGGAAAEVLRRFFETDDVPFTVISGPPFPTITRSYTSFSQAAAENGESRIYAGIHFRTAVEDGIKQGDQIGGFVFTHILQPVE